jgi:tetratricopeptide (TPR) repeat protein
VNKSLSSRVLKFSVMLMLGSCAQLPHTQPDAAVEPVFRVSNSIGSAYGYFLLGAYYSGQDRTQKAAEAYRQALQLDPEMVEAHNALGMLHAQQGRYDEAVRQLAMATRLSPKSAKFHNNLGYVHHLNADYTAAINEFRSALTLDAHHALATNNLQTSCEKLDGAVEARLAPHENAESRPFETFPCVATRLANGTDTNAVERLLDSALTFLRLGPDAHTRPPDRGPDNPARTAAIAAHTERTPGFRLEIVNGNGMPGLARRVRETLRAEGTAGARLTNMKSFSQRDTAIQYRKGFHEEARLLSLKLPTHPKLFQPIDMGSAVDVRLILGKDITAPVAPAITKYAVSERLASASQLAGKASSRGPELPATTRD